eukprot:CAMPEP_0181318842 /NCGR_PEP_ID=MMETSP1101-20121128/17227_1 /TAXON_ID=46948 /ORGANISM="Rhodomonas abbreviata, Strain Caron Lab Isolate" /LENGTH=197 /DNA_ID=CAMNT_0023426349 /DNA_START=35 /DNA_END=628 /DNA_ORIENTATION=+
MHKHNSLPIFESHNQTPALGALECTSVDCEVQRRQGTTNRFHNFVSMKSVLSETITAPSISIARSYSAPGSLGASEDTSRTWSNEAADEGDESLEGRDKFCETIPLSDIIFPPPVRYRRRRGGASDSGAPTTLDRTQSCPEEVDKARLVGEMMRRVQNRVSGMEFGLSSDKSRESRFFVSDAIKLDVAIADEKIELT